MYLLEEKSRFEGYDQLPMDFAMARISLSGMTKP